MELNKAIELAKSFLGDKYFKNLKIEYVQDNKIKGLNVTRNNKEVIITYKSLCELFRGLSLIKEKADLKTYSVSFNRTFKTVGLMLDCSRNGVVRLEQLKELILIQALMGHNRLLLYTEDTYEVTEYPYFGYLRGSYSKKDLKELVEYGENFGVELIPCIQTLDHLEKPLRWDVFDNIREGLTNVIVGEKETYTFIETLIKTCRECFNTKEIHIGMDESFSLGVGRYLHKYGYKDRVELFCEHLAAVIKICKKYDFTPMIWSDMFFRLNDKNSDYYSGEPLPKSTLKLIPKGIDLVYWDYYHDDIKVYDNMFKNHLATQRNIHFAGGAWRWGGFATSLHKSYEFNEVALKSAKKNKIENVFITSWGDNGNESTIYSSLLSLAQYSAAHYLKSYTDKDVDSLLETVTGETKERMLLLDLPNMPDKKVLAAPYNPCKFFFYQDPLLGQFDKQVKNNFSKNYAEFAKILEETAKKSEHYSYIYLNLSNLCKVLELKVDLGVKLRSAYKAKNTKVLKEIMSSTIPEILKRIEVFHASLQNQWLKENRSFGFDVLDGRIGYLKQRLITTSETINLYLKGKLKNIEELEKDILPFSGHDYEVCWNDWAKNVAI